MRFLSQLQTQGLHDCSSNTTDVMDGRDDSHLGIHYGAKPHSYRLRVFSARMWHPVYAFTQLRGDILQRDKRGLLQHQVNVNEFA